MTAASFYLGWDVGAWHCDQGRSRDALCLLTVDGDDGLRVVGTWRGNLRRTFAAHHGHALVSCLPGLCGKVDVPWARLIIGIDTPLGWPQAFRALLAGVAPDGVPSTKDQNPLLLRKTERMLASEGFRPLSAVQDLIGSQSTKGLYFLTRAGLAAQEPGIWISGDPNGAVVAFETYPTPSRTSRTAGSLFAGLRGAVAGAPGLSDEAKADLEDALQCAVVAYLFDRHPEALRHPPRDLPDAEGWIWLPADCTPTTMRDP